MNSGKNRKMIKTIKIIFLILSIIVTVVHLIPIPINRSFDALEIKMDDPSYLVNCQIQISGYYHLNLFSDDTFSGQISVSDYKLTSEKMTPLELGKDGNILEYSYLDGPDESGQSTKMRYLLGLVFSDILFRNMCITVYSDNPLNKEGGAKAYGSWGSWGTNDGYCIVSSVSTREDALAVLIGHGLVTT